MIRAILAVLACVWAVAISAQEFSGLARVEPEASKISDTRDGISVELGLRQGVPWRVFTLADPPRLVLDFREVDWRGLDKALFDWSERVETVRFGGFRPGWSRMVLDLTGPFAIETSEMEINSETGAAQVSVLLNEVPEDVFRQGAGMPDLPGWEAVGAGLTATKRPRQRGENPLVVVIDPGHGGIDPGAEQDGEVEKHLMLIFARELQDMLIRSGDIEVVLTRSDDSFVSLERRVAIAHQVQADLFLSLHADALSEGRARGATVYTLSDSASDAASAALAERHDRADILSGIDLTENDDVVADVLMDLARLETHPRSQQLAKAIQLGIDERGLPLNSRPMRSAGFSVLKSPDIPSVLLELGFLSSPRDLANLLDPAWREEMARAVSEAIAAWRIADAAAAALVRQ